MSAQALPRLDFIVGLIDKVSGPAGKMMKTMDHMTTNIQSGYQKIGYGAAGIAGAGFALDRLIAPTIELDNALRTVKSLDVVDSVLNDLTKTSLKFSMQYGESATDFVASSYDIQSAISGLVGNELSQFTNASAILAKGTKADMGTITNYVGTMYGIFKNSADQMGKGAWVEMLSGQTAQAVQVFKTTGAEMSSSFTRVGASATSHGIAMNEQIAILGTLQATMSGSEAGTRYKAFLDGVGKSQDVLGLSFVDSQGKMLPMVDIMTKIQGKFGDLSTVADSDLLKKAFGSKEAVDLIKLL
jgi:TP901 family phage tail tape measure protein